MAIYRHKHQTNRGQCIYVCMLFHIMYEFLLFTRCHMHMKRVIDRLLNNFKHIFNHTENLLKWQSTNKIFKNILLLVSRFHCDLCMHWILFILWICEHQNRCMYNEVAIKTNCVQYRHYYIRKFVTI